MKFSNDFNKFNMKFISLILLVIHMIIFTLWFGWEKDKLRERARKQAILSNDLLTLLKEREQSYLDTLLSERNILTSLDGLAMVSQYRGALLSSLDDDLSHHIFGPVMEGVPNLKESIYRKWLILGRPFHRNIFIRSGEDHYIGRYVTDTIEKRNYLLIIQMRNPHFPQILNSDPRGFKRGIYIFDENNDLMSGSAPLPRSARETLDSDGYSERVIGGDLYLLITNNINQWKTLLVFRDIFKGSILKIFLMTFLITLPLGLFMLLFFRFFSGGFYHSFKNIVEFLESSMEGDPDKNMADLLQTKRSYEESLPKLREQFLLNILKRREALPEKLIERYSYDFPSRKHYIVGIFPKKLLLMDEFLEYLNNFDGGVDMAPEGEVTAIFSSDSPEVLERIPDEFRGFIGRDIAAFSRVRSSVAHLHAAYEEALFCIHSSLRSASHIITPDSLGRITATPPDTTVIKKKMYSRIREGGIWSEYFDELMECFFSAGYPVMTMKIAFIHLLSEILSLDDDESYEELSEEAFFTFENLSTHSEVREFFIGVIEDLQERLETKRRSEDLKVSRRVEEYITEGFSDMNLTVASMAEEIGYSISFLEKRFKNTHRVSIKEFLIQVRIARAKIFLEQNRDLRIKELAWMVGYENSRSFINIFKKYEGITPGEYKKTLWDI